MSSGVVAIDTDYAVVTMNEGARRILGCPRGDVSEALGIDCRKLLADQPAVAQLLIDALDAQSPLSRAELVLDPVGDRDRSTIGFTLSPVRDERSRICGAAILFRDLTPFERMDEQDRLRERLAALGQMAADLAHEIRNPLAGMQVAAGLLRRRLADRPEEQGLVEQIIAELGAVAATVSASLEFVNPAPVQRELLDPAVLVEEAIEMARSRVGFDGAIERTYHPDLPALCGDADQLRSVVTNLVVNALEAMSEGPSDREAVLSVGLECVTMDRDLHSVRMSSDGSGAPLRAFATREIVIRVSDSGPGIPPELREKIFYPFFTTKPHGSGIGLASAQKIAASHGGIVEVQSDPERGSTFRLRLPVDAFEGREPAGPGAAPTRSWGEA